MQDKSRESLLTPGNDRLGGAPDERYAALRNWLGGACGFDRFELVRASEGASFRRYFRVISTATTYVAMDAPPGTEDARPFVAIAGDFRAAGLNVPAVFAADLDSGFLLLSDFGSSDYLDHLIREPQDADRLYLQAIESLITLQAATPALAGRLPRYDEALLRSELDLFPTWFCARHLGFSLSAREAGEWRRCCDLLVDDALAQPQVAVHRDFHSRNLMVVDSDGPGVIDFQGAVVGPLAYDLVSLLKDCYIVWPAHDTERWLAAYRNRAASAGIYTEQGMRFEIAYRRIGIQRHLKVAGIFCRLNYRDGKSRYLGDLPRVVDYLMAALAEEPQLEFVHSLLAEHWTQAQR